jgi:hypothetical protein
MSKALKDKAWKMFALYIKVRDSNAEGICTCCTCGKEMAFDDQDNNAGHFVAGRNLSILFDEKIVHSQCSKCNLFLNGSQGKYFLFMKSKSYSDEDLEQMLTVHHPPKQIKDFQYIEMIKSYYEIIKKIMNEKFSVELQERVELRIRSYGVRKILEKVS